MITLEQAKEIAAKHITEEHLIKHCYAVCGAMQAMALHFGENPEAWGVIGYLHDIDFEKYPEEHCQHVEELLAPEGLSDSDIRAIVSHGYGLTCDVKPETNMEKSLFTVDELTGIIMATALMRPTGITDLTPKSVNKKFKDKRFAAKCDREVILQGCDMLGMELSAVISLCIDGMKPYMHELSLEGHSV
ncbi:MAG: hypothetical protein HFE64_02480 [Lachnospiraceae bacterium]|jgi:predicted hydrolase (HD superfamily)|nr:hypothetical protein [Lachnospiraceae bacterium]